MIAFSERRELKSYARAILLLDIAERGSVCRNTHSIQNASEDCPPYLCCVSLVGRVTPCAPLLALATAKTNELRQLSLED